MAKINEEVRAALERLIAHARRETGQSRRVADFLLAWWNGAQCGGFDFTTMWGCDDEIVADMLLVFSWVGANREYPDTLGYENDFAAIVADWRPELVGVKAWSAGKAYEAGRRAFREGLAPMDCWGMLPETTKEALNDWMRGYADEKAGRK